LGLAAVNVNEVKNEEQFMNVTPTPAITNTNTFLVGPRKSLHFKKYFLKIVSFAKSHCF
jgi:hypothetical protein